MVLSAQSIYSIRPVSPFHGRKHERRYELVIGSSKLYSLSYGLSPAGYDIRLNLPENHTATLPPGSFVLMSAMERFNMPNDLLGIVHDKSTLARLGLALQNTVIEPGWHGYLTLELSNHGDSVVRLYPGMPIAQVIFHRLDQPTDTPYSGKYQNQSSGPQHAI